MQKLERAVEANARKHLKQYKESKQRIVKHTFFDEKSASATLLRFLLHLHNSLAMLGKTSVHTL